MIINRRWIAREWLYLLAGLLWTFVVAPTIIPPLARLVLWKSPPLYGPVLRLAEGFAFVIMYGPYLIFQLWRITRWAVRTFQKRRSLEIAPATDRLSVSGLYSPGLDQRFLPLPLLSHRANKAG